MSNRVQHTGASRELASLIKDGKWDSIRHLKDKQELSRREIRAAVQASLEHERQHSSVPSAWCVAVML
jgi:hypothetical protein